MLFYRKLFKAVIPALGNEVVVLLKDTSLLSAIGANEIMKKEDKFITLKCLSLLLWNCCLNYLVVTFSLTRVINWYERKLDVSRA